MSYERRGMSDELWAMSEEGRALSCELWATSDEVWATRDELWAMSDERWDMRRTFGLRKVEVVKMEIKTRRRHFLWKGFSKVLKIHDPNPKPATCNLQLATKTCNLQLATFNLPPKPKTCNMHPSTCNQNLQPATFNLQPKPATFNSQPKPKTCKTKNPEVGILQGSCTNIPRLVYRKRSTDFTRSSSLFMALLASTKNTIEMMGISTAIPFSETIVSPDRLSNL